MYEACIYCIWQDAVQGQRHSSTTTRPRCVPAIRYQLLCIDLAQVGVTAREEGKQAGQVLGDDYLTSHLQSQTNVLERPYTDTWPGFGGGRIVAPTTRNLIFTKSSCSVGDR